MKKVLVTISLVVSALTCWAQSAPPVDLDWAVGTVLDNGTRLLYEVLPQTADVKVVNGTEVSTSIIRLVNVDTGFVSLRRILVLGCDETAGSTTLVELNGDDIKGVPIFNWSKDGEKVFDSMATMTCIAVIMSQAQPAKPAEPIKTPAPTKHQRIPQGTTV
jgi:hypothetical protein